MDRARNAPWAGGNMGSRGALCHFGAHLGRVSTSRSQDKRSVRRRLAETSRSWALDTAAPALTPAPPRSGRAAEKGQLRSKRNKQQPVRRPLSHLQTNYPTYNKCYGTPAAHKELLGTQLQSSHTHTLRAPRPTSVTAFVLAKLNACPIGEKIDALPS